MNACEDVSDFGYDGCSECLRFVPTDPRNVAAVETSKLIF